MLCRGRGNQIARAAWKSPALRKHLVKEMSKEVNAECLKMCKKSKPSCLRQTDPESIVNFSFENLNKELDERAPVLKSLLMSASICPEKKCNDKNWLNSVGVAACILLRNRSQNMNAFQLMMTIILQHSGFMVSCQIAVCYSMHLMLKH